MTARDVRVVYTKYDGSLHWHATWRYLGEDEHGTWVGVPAGSSSQRGNEPPVYIGQHMVQLLPRGQWWTAAFYGGSTVHDVYCDISTPPHWRHAGEVTMVDLDLDVLRTRDGQSVLLVDEDEFEEHQVRYGYPEEVINRARQAADWLMAEIRAGAEPFAGSYRGWLEQMA